MPFPHYCTPPLADRTPSSLALLLRRCHSLATQSHSVPGIHHFHLKFSPWIWRSFRSPDLCVKNEHRTASCAFSSSKAKAFLISFLFDLMTLSWHDMKFDMKFDNPTLSVIKNGTGDDERHDVEADCDESGSRAQPATDRVARRCSPTPVLAPFMCPCQDTAHSAHFYKWSALLETLTQPATGSARRTVMISRAFVFLFPM
jgi:hypothetical protein